MLESLMAGTNPVMAIAQMGTQIGGQIYQNNANRGIMNDMNNYNTEQTRAQMDFQERMSSTAHQREVIDLQKAGLNPILSANAGASTPSGGASQSAGMHTENILNPAIATALEVTRLKNDIKKTTSETALLDAQKKRTDIESDVAKRNIPEAELKSFLWQKAKNALSSGAKSLERKKDSLQKWYKENPQAPIQVPQRKY